MISIRKLPSLEPKMRWALRRKRQRLRQEIEQDAIEQRLKKEREQKRLQDAMSLDQIKEQLTQLEKKLETLRAEKHDLFVQLKQVLNEGNSSKRKQTELSTGDLPLDANKKPKIAHNNDGNTRESRNIIGLVASSSTTHTREDDGVVGLSTKRVDSEQQFSSDSVQTRDSTKQFNQGSTELQQSRVISTARIPTSSEFIKNAYSSIQANCANPIMTLPLNQQNFSNLNQSSSHSHHTDSTIDLSKTVSQLQLSDAHSIPINLHDLAVLQAAHLTTTTRHPFISVPNIPPELLISMSGRVGAANYLPNMLPFDMATHRGMPMQHMPLRTLTNEDIRLANFITTQQRVQHQNDLYMTIAGASNTPLPSSTSFNSHKPTQPRPSQDFSLNQMKSLPEQLEFIHPPNSTPTSYPNSNHNMFNNGINNNLHPLYQHSYGRAVGPNYGSPFVNQHQQQSSQSVTTPQGLLDRTPAQGRSANFSSPSAPYQRASNPPRSPYYHNTNRRS